MCIYLCVIIDYVEIVLFFVMECTVCIFIFIFVIIDFVKYPLNIEVYSLCDLRMISFCHQQVLVCAHCLYVLMTDIVAHALERKWMF